MQSFIGALDHVAAWFKDPENKREIAAFIGYLSTIGSVIMEVVVPVIGFFLKIIAGWLDTIYRAGQRFGEFINDVRTGFGIVSDAVGQFGAMIAAFDPFSALKNSFRNAFNWIIDKWNALPDFNLGPVRFSIPN